MIATFSSVRKLEIYGIDGEEKDLSDMRYCHVM